MSEFKSSTTKKTLLGCTAVLIGVVMVGISDAGISRFGISAGRIDRFASIFVNDREFDTATATITIDGQPANVSDLKLGQNVFVDGTLDDELPVGVAEEIVANTDVQGRITSIDIDEERLVVLGTTALIDVNTVIVQTSGGTMLQDFAVGDPVRISGLRTSNRKILATRFEDVGPGSENLVTGEVSNLSGASFEINALTVDFSAVVPNGFPTGVVVEGDNVRVRGDSFGASAELIATSLDFVPAIAGEFQDLGEFEGLISSLVSPSDFRVAGIRVVTDPDTVFVGGGPANLAINTEVVIRGEFDSAGTLVADEIAIRGTRIRVYGIVDSTSASSLTVLGVPLLVVAETRLKDKSDADVDPFQIGDIFAGDYVETRSLKNPPAIPPVVTARVERDEEEDEVLLQGFVDSVGAQSFQMLGTFVDVSAATDYFDANNQEISSQEYFDALTLGTFVKVEGEETSSTRISASEIELQIHD